MCKFMFLKGNERKNEPTTSTCTRPVPWKYSKVNVRSRAESQTLNICMLSETLSAFPFAANQIAVRKRRVSSFTVSSIVWLYCSIWIIVTFRFDLIVWMINSWINIFDDKINKRLDRQNYKFNSLRIIVQWRKKIFFPSDFTSNYRAVLPRRCSDKDKGWHSLCVSSNTKCDDYNVWFSRNRHGNHVSECSGSKPISHRQLLREHASNSFQVSINEIHGWLNKPTKNRKNECTMLDTLDWIVRSYEQQYLCVRIWIAR